MSDWTQTQDHWQCPEDPALEPAIAACRCRCIRIYTQHPTRVESEQAKRARAELDKATDAGGRALLAYYCHPIDARELP